jgi:putative transposase
MANHVRTSRAGTSFVTMATLDRRPIFEISRIAELFIDMLHYYRTHGNYKLHAYLVMPDHVHLLITPESGSLKEVIALIQNGLVKSLDTPHALWEAGFTAYPVVGLRDLETLRAYLHQTPVRAHMTPTAELYPYSSAHRLM